MMSRTLLLSAALLATGFAGCEASSRGGQVGIHEQSFRMTVPSRVDIQQGDTRAITVELRRGDMFTQDVQIQVDSTPGITVDPKVMTVKANQLPHATVRLMAGQDAPLGDYLMRATAMPQTGDPAITEFHVRVVPTMR